MASQYADFLRAPNTALLAADAALVYVTTTTEIKEANAILKHFHAQTKQIEKKDEKVLNAIESQDGLCLETEITILFKQGGGAYLPGIDENHLDERTVTFPLVHIIRFDGEKKIKQIRLYWDQGMLLKQVEAIGKTGRNWPIRDGKAQVDTINKSLNAGGRSTELNGSAGVPAKGARDVLIDQHKKRDSVSATRHPHASLQLFAARDPNADEGSRYEGPSVETRASAKPGSRDLSQILAGEDAAPPAGLRSSSPSKGDGNALKAGAGKHHVTNRLFDENEPAAEPASPERKKVFGQRYDHFEFANGEGAPEDRLISSRGGGQSKQATQINFEDFHTPPNIKGATRPDYECHWGADVQDDDPPSPAKRPVVHAARKDAQTHFKLTDEDSPASTAEHPQGGRRDGAKSLQRQKGMGLYSDPLYEDNRAPQIGKGGNRRRDEYEPHYSISDSTAGSIASSGFEADKKIYKTAGDGMGGRKTATRNWAFGDDFGEGDGADVRPSARSKGGRRDPQQAKTGAYDEFNAGQ